MHMKNTGKHMYTYAVSLPRPATMLKCAGHLYRCPKAVGKSREAGSIVNQRVLARAGVEFVGEGLSSWPQRDHCFKGRTPERARSHGAPLRDTLLLPMGQGMRVRGRKFPRGLRSLLSLT